MIVLCKLWRTIHVLALPYCKDVVRARNEKCRYCGNRVRTGLGSPNRKDRFVESALYLPDRWQAGIGQAVRFQQFPHFARMATRKYHMNNSRRSTHAILGLVDTNTMRRYFCEFIGTFSLVFFAAGAVVVDALMGGSLGSRRHRPDRGPHHHRRHLRFRTRFGCPRQSDTVDRRGVDRSSRLAPCSRLRVSPTNGFDIGGNVSALGVRRTRKDGRQPTQ